MLIYEPRRTNYEYFVSDREKVNYERGKKSEKEVGLTLDKT